MAGGQALCDEACAAQLACLVQGLYGTQHRSCSQANNVLKQLKSAQLGIDEVFILDREPTVGQEVDNAVRKLLMNITSQLFGLKLYLHMVGDYNWHAMLDRIQHCSYLLQNPKPFPTTSNTVSK